MWIIRRVFRLFGVPVVVLKEHLAAIEKERSDRRLRQAKERAWIREGERNEIWGPMIKKEEQDALHRDRQAFDRERKARLAAEAALKAIQEATEQKQVSVKPA